MKNLFAFVLPTWILILALIVLSIFAFFYLKKPRKTMYLICALIVGVAMFISTVPTINDMYANETRTIIGTVYASGRNMKMICSDQIEVQSTNGNMVLYISRLLSYDQYQIVDGHTYEFEYYINSHIIKNVVCISVE